MDVKMQQVLNFKNQEKMKKIFFTIAITLGLTFGAMAQTDSFFNDWNDFENRNGETNMPSLPGEHGLTNDQSAETPVGSGLLILTALGAGYAVSKKKKEER